MPHARDQVGLLDVEAKCARIEDRCVGHVGHRKAMLSRKSRTCERSGFHPAPRPEAPPLDSAKRRALGTQYFKCGIAKAPPLLGVPGATPPGGFRAEP